MSVFVIQVISPPVERPDDWISAETISEMTGFSVRTIKEGKAGFNVIAVNRDPLRWLRKDVHDWMRGKAERSRPTVNTKPMLLRRKRA
jgi:hypothetical protein